MQGLAGLVALPRREAVVGGLTFLESLSVTRIAAGIADNVIPDRAVATLSFRYAPDRTPEDAERHLGSLVPEHASLELRSNSPAARVVRDSSLVDALLAAGARGIEPKQAWTNVADFTARGLDAVNFGPGDPEVSHTAGEHVTRASVEGCFTALAAFLRGRVV